jgi:hypothetical protein
MKNSFLIAVTLAAGIAIDSQAQEFYNAPGSGGGAAGQALSEGTVGQELGMIDASSEEGLSPLSLLARKPFQITVSVREGFDDNVNTTKTNRQQSFYTNFSAGINYSFGSPRLKLATNLGGGFTFYNNPSVANRSRLSGLWDLSALYTASPRLTLAATTNTGYYSQPNILVPGTNIAQQGDYFASTSTISALYQWVPRFSTTTAYTFNAIVYVDNDINDNQGRIQQTLSQSFNFMFWPTTTLVAEYRISPTTYFSADLDTLDQYMLAGFDHVFSPRASWNLRAGVQYNLLNNPVDGTGTYFGPYGETGFTYRYGDVSQLSFTARYGTEASGLNNVTQRQSLRSGIGIVHGLTPRLQASGGLFYGVNYYDQANVISSYTENILEGTLGLTYEFNRFLSVSSGYRFTGVLAPTNTDQEYSRNVIFLGLNTTF